MSSGGQAPNVSMDELLSSIKSMIEGESTDGLSSNNGTNDMGAGGPEAATPPSGAPDAGIMDLTQVVQPQAAVQEQPAGGVPQNANPQSAEETAAQINDILGGMSADLGVSNDDLTASANPADQLMDGFEPQAQTGEQEQPQSPPDIDFGMQEDLGVARGGEAPVDPAAGQPMDAMAGQDPGLAQVSQVQNPDMGPDMGQDPLASEVNPMGGDLSGQQDFSQPDGAQVNAELTRGLNSGMDPDAFGQGMPPMGGQGMGLPQGQPQSQLQGQPGGHPQGQAFQPQSGQPPMGQAPAPMPVQQPGAQPGPMGQSPQAQMGGAPGVMPAPHGQPVSQPPAGHDPRMESEFAMGQALSQADASLSASPALQQQMVPGANMRGLQPPAPQGYPQGQIPGQMPQGEVGGGYDLPVPAAGRAMVPAQQPMMQVADPSVDQLPVEMRNNLEEIVKQLLKPLLREWLERNLPELLKGAVDEQGKIDPDCL